MSEINNHSLGLAENESIVKSWTYAKTTGKVASTHDLIVTNKRIIAMSNSKMSNGTNVTRNEIRREKISSVYVSASVQNFILLGVIFTILAIAGLVLGIQGQTVGYVMFACFAIVAIIFFIKKKSSITLVICQNIVNHDALQIAAWGARLKANKTKLKVKVDPTIANEIVRELGGILLVDAD